MEKLGFEAQIDLMAESLCLTAVQGPPALPSVWGELSSCRPASDPDGQEGPGPCSLPSALTFHLPGRGMGLERV